MKNKTVAGQFTRSSDHKGAAAIGANMHAFAYSVRVLSGANLSMGTNSTLEITKNNP
ncbi:MAG: hypothetical protein V4685_08820 [Bacteroidota bacterium]